jgi:hypothetical protein
MAKPVWSGVAVAVQSALAAAVAITAISKANPAVALTATTPSNGAFVLITAAGMKEVDQRVFRVANVSSNVSFELEGENSTNYNTFTAGTYQVITFGTSLSTVSELSAAGGDFEYADQTTIHDISKQEVPTVANAVAYTLTNLYDPSDAGLIALATASRSKGSLAFRFTFAAGEIVVGYGTVAATMAPTGTAQNNVTTPVDIRMAGVPTGYAAP